MSLHPQSYSNPAFCQQSEYYPQRCKSPPRNIRQSPVGAQTTIRMIDHIPPPIPGPKPVKYEEQYEEQEFYEEMIVDRNGAVQEKKFVVVHNENKPALNRYASIPQCEEFDDKPQVKTRYEYIPMQEQQQRKQYHEEEDASTGRIHRYAVILPEDLDAPAPRRELPPKPSGRYALVPVEEVPNKSRYAVVTQEELKPSNRYEYIDESYQRSPPRKVISPRQANPAATQKLHELLSTPRKTPQKTSTPRVSPLRRTPQIIKQNPRAQQKLNYTLSTRHPHHTEKQQAIVAPIVCSSPVQSVYGETTFSNKSESWMNLSMKRPQVQATLAVAAFMLILCGGVTSGLCFYMISSIMGRLYFLDFAIVSGFTCLLLGLMGFRARNIHWLPNRNYISGYLILSVFSLLTCAGLLVLLFMQPKPGTPLADMTSGAVCGISGLSLLLASSGVVASYCCKQPPPDNRVQHCAPGFIV